MPTDALAVNSATDQRQLTERLRVQTVEAVVALEEPKFCAKCELESGKDGAKEGDCCCCKGIRCVPECAEDVQIAATGTDKNIKSYLADLLLADQEA